MRMSWAVIRRFSLIWILAAGTWALLHGSLGTSCPHGLNARGTIFVDAAMFGVEMPADDEGTVFFVETSRVPMVVGTTFGWRMHLEGAPPLLQMREELILPEAPRTWRYDGATEISRDRHTATTSRTVKTVDGWLENYWSFTEGDPEGIYKLRVYAGDELLKEFRFRVEAVERKVGKGCGGHGR